MENITIENFFLSSKGVFREISQVPSGFRRFFTSRGSRYYVSPDGSHLVRLSDHWGKGIRECEWNLEGYPLLHCSEWRSRIGRRMGIISFSELESLQLL